MALSISTFTSIFASTSAPAAEPVIDYNLAEAKAASILVAMEDEALIDLYAHDGFFTINGSEVDVIVKVGTSPNMIYFIDGFYTEDRDEAWAMLAAGLMEVLI